MTSQIPTKAMANPSLVLSPCCGKPMCARCAIYDDHLNSLDKGSGDTCADRHYIHNIIYRYRKHLRKYDHSLLEIEGA